MTRENDVDPGLSRLPSEVIGKLVGMAILEVIQGDWDSSPLWEGFSRFVPRLSWKDGYLLRELPTGRPIAVAKALAQAGGDAQLVLQAHRDPMRRVVLDPEAWRNQQPASKRSTAFRTLGPLMSLAGTGTLDPASLRTSRASALVEYSLAFVNVEHVRGADAVLTPSHLAGGHGEATREGELLLAEAAVRIVRRERIAERGERAKPLLAGVTVDAAALNDSASAVAVARSYASLDVDGYWVQFANLTEVRLSGSCATAARSYTRCRSSPASGSSPSTSRTLCGR